MQFRDQIPIYLQIADIICENILLKQWLPEQRIPSIRDFATQLIVNPNTIVRTYEFLEQKRIIMNQRGIGFSITKEGYELVLAYKKEDFIKKDLPHFFKQLYLLNLDIHNLEEDFNKFCENYKK
ncbi:MULTISPECIES: GntR family transcriptional regulator [Chryseobacterium]|jgi:DNA-binding transcriptional regulator YhcF (GntR family)|uniref:GntR family transcriptional regulator n=1 Tax=Chryseobacterium TaxID=59732 RepID=UPI001AE18664|nr:MULTISPECIES: GntR family transcriptional regulator [Chryseobacterium]MBP1164558.1 DNA-binding transcriptional regulator YhcF (GntR family) [Chryseobacterium sp. PvR013]MDR6461631.1 DNA-binding transcriptional regulator YhcF (GntR family) [Chryseobacterium sediminis]